jgi:hypothetical protein
MVWQAVVFLVLLVGIPIVVATFIGGRRNQEPRKNNRADGKLA